jgi:hypothetical protein
MLGPGYLDDWEVGVLPGRWISGGSLGVQGAAAISFQTSGTRSGYGPAGAAEGGAFAATSASASVRSLSMSAWAWASAA